MLSAAVLTATAALAFEMLGAAIGVRVLFAVGRTRNTGALHRGHEFSHGTTQHHETEHEKQLPL
jgi:hypothetical protein